LTVPVGDRNIRTLTNANAAGSNLITFDFPFDLGVDAQLVSIRKSAFKTLVWVETATRTGCLHDDVAMKAWRKHARTLEEWVPSKPGMVDLREYVLGSDCLGGSQRMRCCRFKGWVRAKMSVCDRRAVLDTDSSDIYDVCGGAGLCLIAVCLAIDFMFCFLMDVVVSRSHSSSGAHVFIVGAGSKETAFRGVLVAQKHRWSSAAISIMFAQLSNPSHLPRSQSSTWNEYLRS
jgi:hypothetical protein